MKQHSLWFTAPGQVEVREEDLPAPPAGQVRVRVLMSAISAGTELLAYRGLVPPDMALDESIAALGGTFAFPFKYGYACVGVVESSGPGVEAGWLGRRVFSFHPHENAFNAPPSALMPVPDQISSEDALFLPNLETAVNFVMDAQPLLGEQVAVFGLGIVGLLTTALLAHFPLSALVTLDRYPLRREAALRLGASASLDPAEEGVEARLLSHTAPGGLRGGADLAFELSGSPAALNQAIAVTGFSGRILIGSWYGSKPSAIDLGGKFHRSRIHLISSQVSTLSPQLSGRWSKERRLSLAWELAGDLRPSRYITQRFTLEQASQAYTLLEDRPGEAIQIILVNSEIPALSEPRNN